MLHYLLVNDMKQVISFWVLNSLSCEVGIQIKPIPMVIGSIT